MSKSSIGRRRAGISSLATTALVLGAAVAGAGAASADATFAFDRIGGADRYETAAKVSDAYGDSADVILANGEQGHFPDALVANYLAGVNGSPILLTRAANMPQFTEDQLVDSGAESITIVGGTGVVSAAQEAGLVADGYTVDRVSGADRYATNAAVINEAGAAASNTAIVTTGVDFPDALGASPLAYHEGMPLAITSANNINDTVVDALVDSGVSEFVVLGGPTIVGPAVIAELEAAGIAFDQRLSGADRAETSVKVANYAIDTLNFVNTGINVASGYIAGTGADALAGGPLTGEQVRALLITRNVDVPGASVLDFLEENANTLTEGIIFGGTAAVSTSAENAMEAAARMVTSNQDFAVTPSGDRTGRTSTAGLDQGRQSTTVSGITSSTVDIALVPCANETNNGGVVSFADADGAPAGSGDNKADLGTTPALIETVNGIDVTDATYFNDVNVVNGAVQFTVDSQTPTCVVAVVFDDANDDNAINLNAANEPTEAFAVTGDITFTAPPAGTGVMDENVSSVNKANNSFVGCEITSAADPVAETVSSTDCGTFNYDANDTYYIDADDNEASAPSEQATFAEFEAQLSSDDDVQGDYNANPALVSTFLLGDEAPTAPTVSDAATAGAESTSVTLTITDPTSGAPNSYNVYRFTGTAAAADFTATPNGFTKIATVTPETDGATTYVATGLSPSTTYTFVVTSLEDGDESAGSNESEATTAATNVTDSTGPLSNDAVVTTNGGFGTVFDGGDVFKVAFNEAIAAPTGGDSIRAQDGDAVTPTIADFVNGTNATFTRNAAPETVNGVSRPANTVLTVTLTAAPTTVQAGTVAGLQIPATVIDQSGNTDTSGNGWNITGSPDKFIDQDADDTAAFGGAAPTFDSLSATDGGNTVTLTFNEAILCSTVDQVGASEDVTFTDDGASDPTVTGATCTGVSDATIVYAVTAIVAPDNITGTLASAGAVTDVDGNPVTGTLVRTAVAGA